jgi:hypothetical protein
VIFTNYLAPAPEHPLISVINIKPVEHIPEGTPGNVINGFYSISLKKGFKAPVKFKYGQQAYDFDEGVLSFMSPGQISGFDPQKNMPALSNQAGCFSSIPTCSGIHHSPKR